MVIIVNCVKRVSNLGEEFTALIVQSELELVKSKKGNIYCKARKASIPSTLEFEIAKMQIGKELPGYIEKVKCQPFETVDAEGEIVTLNHRYQYVPESNRTEVEEMAEIPEEELLPETV